MNNESQILNVPIEDIIPNRFQPRLNFDENSLKELSASIKEHGIIQPLVLRHLGDKYEIIAGERRYKAAKMAGLTFVPAIISSLDDRKSAEVAIVENIQRKDLSSIEEAKSYKALLDKGYLTQEELAKKMGLSQSAISNKLRLLSLSENVQNALMENKISERHARSLLQLIDKNEQDKWLKIITEERLTVRELDKRLKGLVEDKEEDIPIVEMVPNINEIKEKATDIVPNKEIKDIVDFNIPNNMNFEENPIPNKFFNILEDEETNMSVVEPESNISQFDDEIEMLDFIAPELHKEDIGILEKFFDLSNADNLLDNLIKELIKENYKVKLDKNDLTNEIKYIITIKKS